MIKRQPNFSSQSNDGDATLFIYDEIGGWGIWAEDVIRFVRAVQPIQNLTMRFHSPGGDIQVGAAITGFLSSAREMGMIKEIMSVVDGACYSVSTYICMVGERVSMSELGLWLLHKPTATLTDTSDGLRAAAATVDALEQIENQSLATRSGNTVEQIAQWVDGEGSSDGTMFTAQQALEAGFVDEIVQPINFEQTEREFSESVQAVRGAEQYARSKITAGASRGYMNYLPNLEDNRSFLNRYWAVPTEQKAGPDPVKDAAVRHAAQVEARKAITRILARRS